MVGIGGSADRINLEVVEADLAQGARTPAADHLHRLRAAANLGALELARRARILSIRRGPGAAGRRSTPDRPHRGTDTIGRIGGDAFVVLLTDIAHAAGALRVAEQIGEARRQPLLILDQTLSTSASIGIAL
jgi:hypothetical protein